MTGVVFDVGYAHQYQDDTTRQHIARCYQQRWKQPDQTPETHPWLYDPLNPPAGWCYDAFYEMWIRQ